MPLIFCSKIELVDETSRLLKDETTTRHHLIMAPFDDSGYFGSRFREFRHSPCMMTPLSVLFFVLFGCFMLLTLLFQFPTFVVGLLLGPILKRNNFFIEFLFPFNIARDAWFFIMSKSSVLRKGISSLDKNRGFHSRTIEQRIEVVPGRVYIHPLPQWVDNVGYLILCLPKPPKTEKKRSNTISIHEGANDPILAVVIDCGHTDAVVKAVKMIQKFHYSKMQPIQIQSILSTHKHHDHTGGNGELLKTEVGKNIDKIFGGAVERVPYCTDFVADGDILTLPNSRSNDMNSCIFIEAIAVPGHTRGSLVYRLRSKTSDNTEFLFTGDTMFSGGSGVPFESDIGTETEAHLNASNGNTFFRGNIGSIATERCFAELIYRTIEPTEQILIFPGHEYNPGLLGRQFQSETESNRWKLFPPKDFFETVSHMYLAHHRRALPQNSGKLLLIPSTMQREIHINPVLRSMKRTGDNVVRALAFWYHNFCRNKKDGADLDTGKKKKKKENKIQKTQSVPKSWTMDASNFSHNVFTTVYTDDLESIISGLSSGKLGKRQGAEKLRDISQRLNEPVINKKAIPGFLPSDKNIFRGVSGLARLGSGPSAMTLSDSINMKVSPPIDSNSDKILISRKRLLAVLNRLGLKESETGDSVGYMIDQLWMEAAEFVEEEDDDDAENGKGSMDKIELGVLKWLLYGVPANQPSWFSKAFCLPCSKIPKTPTYPEHPVENMKQKSGEMVSHDVYNCLLCRNSTGCLVLGKPGKTKQEIASDEEGFEVERSQFL